MMIPTAQHWTKGPPKLNKHPCWTLSPSLLKNVKKILNFRLLVLLRVWGTVMDFDDSTSCGWCMVTEWVSERERASVSLSPDPQPSAVHTLSRPFSMLFSSLLWACWHSRKCVFPTRWTVPIWSLVILGCRPVLWLSSTIGYRKRGREGWWPRGDYSWESFLYLWCLAALTQVLLSYCWCAVSTIWGWTPENRHQGFIQWQVVIHTQCKVM